MTTIKHCMGYFRLRAPSPNVHPKALGRMWAWVVVRLLADDGPTAMTASDKQKPTSVGEWAM